MKSKVIALASVLLLAVGITTPASAAEQKRLVIIDSGVNTQLD